MEDDTKIDSLEKALTTILELRVRAEIAEANYAYMVNRAANEKLDGYRELGQKAANAENQVDALHAELAKARENYEALERKLGEREDALLEEHDARGHRIAALEGELARLKESRPRLFFVKAYPGWGYTWNLVEAMTEDAAYELVRATGQSGTMFTEDIALQGVPGIRWTYEESPDSPRETD